MWYFILGIEADVPVLDSQLLPKSAALTYFHTKVKRTGDEQLVFYGAMCECCFNRCTLYEISQYCRDPQAVLEQFSE